MAKAVDAVRNQQSRHVATMNWLAEHPEVLDGYDEGWVAVEDQRVVAHGLEFDEVTQEAERHGFDDPLLVPVMPGEWIL